MYQIIRADGKPIRRITFEDLEELGLLTIIEVRERERERIERANDTIATAERASERMLAVQKKLDDCPDTLRVT